MSLGSQHGIRVLHVDDEPDFADLTGAFLEREDDRFTVEAATSAEEGLQRITDRPPDCVVSDYDMPGMDGIEFLRAVRKEHPDLPFILFTGKGSEEVASDALTAGATDYIQKRSGSEQYELLANRIDNAVTQYRSEERLRETRREYTAVFENAGNALILVQVDDDEFRYQQCNPRAVELIGRDEAEIAGNTPHEALGPENGAKVVGAYRTCIERREPVAYTVTLDLPMGKVIRECEVTPVPSDGDITQLVVEFRDVTERRERRQELEEYGTIIRALTDAVYVLDEEGKFTYVNDEFVALVGYDRDTILGSLPSLLKDEEAVERAEQQLGRLLSSDGPDTVTFEVTIHPRDDDPIVCEDHMGVLPYEGDQFNGSVGTLRDITDRKERERELARTHDLMAKMERMADVGAWEYDPGAETLVMTDGAYRIHGLDPAVDPTLEAAFDNFHPDDRDVLADRFDECLETGEPYEVDVRLTTAEGTQRWVTARGERITDSEDSGVVRGYIQDITDRKRIERALEQEHDLVTGIVETVPVGLSVVDADGSISFMNERMESITGRSLEDIENDPYDDSRYDLVDEHGDPLGSGDAPFDQVVSQEVAIHDRVVGVRHPSGERVWLSVHGAPQYNDAGELDRAVFAFEDITEQRELEVELSEVLGRISDGFFALDEEFRFTHINDRAEELLQASEDELLGETLWDVFPEAAEMDKIGDDLHAAMETQEPRSHELYYEPLDLWTDVTIYPSESGVSVYFRDVTESKERKQELKQVRNRMEFALESTDAIVWDYNVDEDRATFYPDEEDLYGAAVETVDDFVQLIHPDDRQAVADSIERSIETGDPIHHEFRIVRNGEIRWVDGPGRVVKDDDDTTRMIGVARDITERKTREQQLERFRKYTERILDAIDDLFYVTDVQGNLQRWNDAFTEATGYTDEEIASMNGIEFVPEEHRERTAAAIEEVFETGHGRLEAPLLTKSGETIRYEYAAARVDPPDGDPRLVGVGWDISERKEYERRLEAQNERLEEFTSVVSHDLRNPLRVADGRLELIRDECESDHIDDVARALDRMDALIEDLLTLAREGEQVDETEPVGLANVATDGWQTTNTEQATFETEISRAVEADRSRLRQLFENLYRNAVEHGGDGVTVSVGATDDGFYVADTGPGIHEDDREDIFEAGYSTNEDGTGFGLRIVERIADAHGWEVTVTESERGGARFDIIGVEFADR